MIGGVKGHVGWGVTLGDPKGDAKQSGSMFWLACMLVYYT